ncbi:MAG: hypothetical protein L3K15_06935 [Thermoplasmata archaeon]|nr:hypothetical protein [Thermoplasmata archaeon]
MGAVLAWSTTLALLMAGMVALQRLGIAIGPMVTSIVRGIAHMLGHPL